MYQLVKPFIQSQSLNGLTYTCEKKDRVGNKKKGMEVEGEAVGPPMSEDKRRCHVCISNLAGVGHELKKNLMYK